MSFADASPRRHAGRSVRVGLGRLAWYGVLGNAAGAVAAFVAVAGYLALSSEAPTHDIARIAFNAGFFALVTAAIGIAYLLVAVPVLALLLRRGRRAFLAAAAVLALLPAAMLFGNRYVQGVALAHGVAAGAIAAVLVLRRDRAAAARGGRRR